MRWPPVARVTPQVLQLLGLVTRQRLHLLRLSGVQPNGRQRLRVADSKVEKIADLQRIRRLQGEFGNWFGLGPGDTPLLLRNSGSQQIYALDWEAP